MHSYSVAISSVLMICCLSPSLFAADAAADVSRVLAAGQRPADARLTNVRNLRDKYHPWSPPNIKSVWEREADSIRKRLLVSNGLWPMPPKQPLQPVVHGKIDRDDYTIEKVFFASHPGHYVSGNLYRPKNVTGKLPGVLCPHGHWQNARFYDAGEEKAKQEITDKAEKMTNGARSPIQARLVQLARMGCVVFHYDMVGYCDSKQIQHTHGFTDAAAGLRLQNFMGLQTFNSLRALDFLTSLEEVDVTRIGVTGASGGGTQTFMLCALDPRPTVAFPAVMVSTAMQGGCICENADYLRLGINNVAIAALFAPKPMALSGANDWTIDIETKGYPELRQIYSLFEKPDFIYARAYPQFGHNYNNVAREMMYGWFNQHLELGLDSPVEERDFKPVSAAELSVFDDQHPLPADARTSEQLRDYLTEVSHKQYQQQLPENAEQLARYKEVVGTAVHVMLDTGVPERDQIVVDQESQPFGDNLQLMKGTLGRVGAGEMIPFVLLAPQGPLGKAVLWVDGKGKSHLFDKAGEPNEAVNKLLAAGYAVISADLFGTGEYLEEGKPLTKQNVNEGYSGYTYGYNRTLLSNRVRDILTVIGAAGHHGGVYELHLVGTGEAGPWALLARSVADISIDRTVVDLNGFSFSKVTSTADPMFLPGALRYGGLGGLAAVSAPRQLIVAGTKGVSAAELAPLKAVYAAVEGKLTLAEEGLNADAAAAKILAE